MALLGELLTSFIDRWLSRAKGDNPHSAPSVRSMTGLGTYLRAVSYFRVNRSRVFARFHYLRCNGHFRHDRCRA